MSLNLYTYCANNPVRYVDPSGHSYATLPDGSTMTINSAWDAAYFKATSDFMNFGNYGSIDDGYSVGRLTENILETSRKKTVKSKSTYTSTENKIRNTLKNTGWNVTDDIVKELSSWTSPVKKSDYRNDVYSGFYKTLRSSGTLHNGVDFYPMDSKSISPYNNQWGADGTSKNVYAVSSGKVVDYCSNFYASSSAVVVQHGNFYVVYGEISTELTIGQTINQGDIIGSMQYTTDDTMMLHLEVLNGYENSSHDSRAKYEMNPTFTWNLAD